MKTGRTLRWSNSPGYGFVTGRLRAQETLLLDRNYYERLIRAEGINEFAAVLNETRYARFIADAGDIATALQLAQEENLQFCLDYIPEKWLSELLRLQVDTYNLKITLKSQLTGKSVTIAGLMSQGNWPIAMVAGIDPAAGANWLERETGFHAVKGYALQVLRSVRETNDPAVIDIMLDRWAQERALALTDGKDYARGYFQLFADVTNLKTLFRLRVLKEGEGVLRQSFLPGGEIKQDALVRLLGAEEEKIRTAFSASHLAPIIEAGLKTTPAGGMLPLEKAGREVLLDYVNTARYVALGYEPLLRFYFLRENELVNLRQLFAAKVAGLDINTCQGLVVYGL